MIRGYRAFLMGTATDLPTRGYSVAKKTKAEELFGSIRKWNKVISSAKH